MLLIGMVKLFSFGLFIFIRLSRKVRFLCFWCGIDEIYGFFICIILDIFSVSSYLVVIFFLDYILFIYLF